jgi:hypothetical protein
MFGLGEAMLGFLRRQVGLRTDAADANGSAHSKLAYIAANTGIKSVQRGTIALGASDTTKTVTISAVTTGKAMVNSLGVSSGNSSSYYTTEVGNGYYVRSYYAQTGHHFVRLQLTNGTTVTATRDTHNSEAATVSYEVIEFA